MTFWVDPPAEYWMRAPPSTASRYLQPASNESSDRSDAVGFGVRTVRGRDGSRW
jgi:hypothetical protein